MNAVVRSIIRNALKPKSSPLCSCFADGGKNSRQCYGVCEDAVDRVVSALEQSNVRHPSADLESPMHGPNCPCTNCT